MTLHLQGIGSRQAKLAQDIKVGDTLVWNFGYKSQVLEIVKETKSQIVIKTMTENGQFERRMSKSKLVAYE